MTRCSVFVMISVVVVALCGCVERRLTIVTSPPGATVVLNDQPIGTSPVTVPFNWYGDYWVRISKDGYETLDTHRELEAPLHDYFPFDFFAQNVYPGRIVDAYEWTFSLSPKVYPTRDELLEEAATIKKQMEGAAQ